MELAYQK